MSHLVVQRSLKKIPCFKLAFQVIEFCYKDFHAWNHGIFKAFEFICKQVGAILYVYMYKQTVGKSSFKTMYNL